MTRTWTSREMHNERQVVVAQMTRRSRSYIYIILAYMRNKYNDIRWDADPVVFTTDTVTAVYIQATLIG